MKTAFEAIIPYQLKNILNEMDACLEAGMYYPALLVALTLPEICTALTTTPDVQIKWHHYEAFVANYCDGLGIDGPSCYRLRGGVVHRGNAAGHQFIGLTNVVFTTPSSGSSVHGTKMFQPEKSALVIDLAKFCSSMKAGVFSWYAANKDSDLVKKNIPELLSPRSNGIAPWVGGGGIIASGP